jgi:hypothetical protein
MCDVLCGHIFLTYVGIRTRVSASGKKTQDDGATALARIALFYERIFDIVFQSAGSAV